MDELFSAYDAAKNRGIRGDFIDRLHSRYTIYYLLVILILIVSKQYSDDGAISCWLPTQFSDEQVINNYLYLNL